jgi:uncharacterized protein YfaS (alpha-2-macroglobulin family)
MNLRRTVLALLSTTLLCTAARAQSLSATLLRDTLTVTVPYHDLHHGTGRLTVEILDPDDKILGHSEHTVSANPDGQWQQQVTPSAPLVFNDLIWERLRTRFVYNGETTAAFTDTVSISEILRRPVLHILGQSTYLTGGKAALRILVTDAANQPIGGGSVRIELLEKDHPARELFHGHINARGTAEAELHLPAGLTGSFDLHTVAETAIGSTEATQTIRLEDKASILLSTEKPIYQPGQTIHVRALALQRADHRATANRPLTFEVEDSRGNKVFKKITQTDAYGIASAEFALADEVNLGTYHLRALMFEPGNTIPTNTAELALNVEKYVLPKFKVAVDLTQINGKPKRDYRPGDHVTGTVQANYFFGKPVSDAEITLQASSADVAVFDVASVTAKTDHDGAYKFDITLPAYFAGKPLTQGAARVLLSATVKDSAAHAETRAEPITVSPSALLITAVPEGGKLIPGLDNQVYLLTAYPDGTPAATQISVRLPDGSTQHLTTDSGGIAVLRLKANKSATSLEVDADDHHGSRASSTVPLQSRSGDDQILLRANRAVYRTGDRIDLNVFSTKLRGAAYIDIVKDGQTILTRDADLTDGHAELSLTATPEMSGTLDLSAYILSRNAQPVADHRLLFIQPADELKITATTDATTYKPGDDAHIHFHVTNAKGAGVSAALGLQVVDEAVFALAEQQPGFAKVFFYLEQEAMKPRYEIHSLSMSNVVEPINTAQGDPQDRAAQVLFSATELPNPNQRHAEFGRELPTGNFFAFEDRYQKSVNTEVKLVSAQLSKLYAQKPDTKDAVKLYAKLPTARDPWGTEIRLEPLRYWYGNGSNGTYYQFRSAGPDRNFNTPDDLTVGVMVRPRMKRASHSNGYTHPIDIKIEHDRGPDNGLAEITGSIGDMSGAIIPRASVEVRNLTTAIQRNTASNQRGEFSLPSLPPGRYKVSITAQGFVVSATEVTLASRDRAVLTAILQVGAVTETVEVADGVSDMVVMPVPGPRAARVMLGNGMPGGVMGGIGAGRGMAMPMAAAPMAQGRAFMAMDEIRAKAPRSALSTTLEVSGAEDTGAAAPDAAPRVRSYFPEALYINPEILTDAAGNADIAIPLADSITTWRMAMLASTQSGALGTATGALKVFQDFFVDLDLPVTLTQGDRVTLPVAIYNYAGARGDVSLSLQQDDWFSLVNDSPDKTVSVDAGQVGSSQYSLQANRIGKFKLTLSATMKGTNLRRDIVVREIEVVPNGREQTIVFNGHLDSGESSGHAQHDIAFPAAAIPDASKIFVRLYPGPLSEIIEGMDSILRMPGGCFEQTSSSTYPNVLALDYMKRTKKLTPEVHAKAEGYIANGYQRLLTFEVPGGGFSWFGEAPANKILTAYGLMEFSDMAKVYDVDPKVITRTSEWLTAQQQPDGSWKPDTNFINEGATNRYNTDVLRITAYLAWSLADTGYHGPAVNKARAYIASHLDAKPDAYTLAVLANFAVADNKDRDLTARIFQLLLDAHTEKDDKVSWTTAETSVYSTGESATVETTGLAAQALLKWGQSPAITRKALAYLASTKQASGNWGSTQATIMALRALVLASESSSADVRGTADILLNGKLVQSLTLTPDNNDLFHQFVLAGINASQPNAVELRFHGTGSLAYQVAGSYFTPWEQHPAQDVLSIHVAYDRTQLAANDIATATATIRNNTGKTANMVMVDLGIPPGFDLLSEDLQSYQEKSAASPAGRLEKFSQTATQAILYFDSLGPNQTVTLTFRLHAKYPIHAHTFESRVYEYYAPDIHATAAPAQFDVTAATP